ncbi:auxilin-related protein 2 [Neltuma alba]|uniref:auxilin-related protein 2 n=1 Tax=Neltuma alba TaxID=207710 RepID=UPI0010A3FD5C|nr:auxilin-related protein 2-like [Prosopis alba]
MDQFGVLTASYGLKPQGKSAPMASAKQATNFGGSQSGNFGINTSLHSKSAQYGSRSPQHPTFDCGSFLDDHNGVFGSPGNKKSQHFGSLDDEIDIFGGPNKPAFQSNASGGDSFGFDSIFMGSNNSVSRPSASNNYVDDIFGGIPDLESSIPAKTEHGLPAFPSPTKQHVPIDDILGKTGSLQSKFKTSNKKGYEGLTKSAPEFDDLIPGFGGSSITNNRAPTKANRPSKQTVTSHDDPFLVFETTSTSESSGSFLDPLEQITKLNNSGGTRGSSNTPSLRPPPRPTNGLNVNKASSSALSSSIDELEVFAMGQVRSNARAHIHGRENRQNSVAKTNKSKGAPDSAKVSQMKTVDDLESFFSMSSRSSSAPKSRATTLDQTVDGQMQNKRRSEVPQRVPSGSTASMRKSSSTTSFDDLSLIFDSSLSSKFEGIDGEPEERRKARLRHHQRTEQRAAKAVADMKQRNLRSTMEQEERRRIAETLDAEIKRWAAGKEGNMRALLSTLQYVLWPECAWQPVSLADIITSASVKKVYRRATLCVHPDKVQQKGASLEQRYIAEKVFDILKEAWNKFNAEELS